MKIVISISALVGTFYLLFSTLPVSAAPTPKTCRVGIYITSLYNLDPIQKSFGAEFWAWSICPFKDLRPLENLEIMNANSVKAEYDSIVETKDLHTNLKGLDKVYWSQRKFNVNLRHDWSLRNFPFDRQVLEIWFEEASLDSSSFVYTPDRENTKYKEDIKLDGWRIKNINVQVGETLYHTTFGDPMLKISQSSYSRLQIAIELVRESRISFLKLIAGVYAGFATTIITFFLEFSSRPGLLVGSLFAVLVNMTRIEAVIGRTAYLTLVDNIHILTLAYIFIAAILSIYSNSLVEVQSKQKALFLDRKILFPLFTTSYFVINIILIANAIF